MKAYGKKLVRLVSLLALIALVLPLCGCAKPIDMHGHTKMYGVNIHNKNYPSYPGEFTDEYLDLAAYMGSNIVRINDNPTDEESVKYMKSIAKKCHSRGMQIMLCMDDKNGTPEEIADCMTYIAENLASDIDYFQVFNETDIWCSQNDDGSYYNNVYDWTGMTEDYYNPERVAICVEKMAAAVKAFRAAAPDAQLVINIGSRHYPVLDKYIEAGIEWDIIGYDIYELDIWDHAAFFKEMEERYPGYDFMVTECNCPPSNPFKEEKRDKWIQKFFDIMEAYDSDRMKAVILYELMDEPNFEVEKGGIYDGESHFGLVNTNEDYTPGAPKSSYFAARKWILGDDAE